MRQLEVPHCTVWQRGLSRSFATALAALALAGCSALSRLGAGRDEQPRVPQPSTDVRAERLVHAAVLEALFAQRGAGRVVLAERTTTVAGPRPIAAWLRRPSALHTTTYKDFRAKNAAPHPLPGRPKLRVPIKSIDGDERDKLTKGSDGAWRAFFAEHRGAPGVVELSRVGFRPDGLQAFVFVRLTCGPRCREEMTVLAERHQAGPWRVSERHLLLRRGRAPLAPQGPVVAGVEGRPE